MLGTSEVTLRTHESLVRRLAHSLVSRLPANIELDDLIQEGLIAVWKSLPRYDPEQGGLETFLTHRIRGAFLDYLRSLDTLTRWDRRQVRRLEYLLDRDPNARRTDLAKELGVTLDQLEDLLMLRGQATTISVDQESSEGDEFSLLDAIPNADGNPYEALRIQECIRGIERAIGMSSPGDREIAEQVFERHYLEGQELSIVAEYLGVTESRVCQIASQLRTMIEYRIRY